MAIACPITSALSTHLTSSFSFSAAALSSLSLTLHPACAPDKTTMTDHCTSSLAVSVPSSIFASAPRQQQTQSQIATTTTARHAVITIQTFKNRFTGPMLYMFTRHYQRLGYAVIVFDRFANHKDMFASDFSSPHLPTVHYYGYTMFEKMLPDIYNASYHMRQVGN